MSAAVQPSDALLPASEASRLALQQMVARLASQVDAAHGEIGETRAILKDAVERLMPAFTALRCNEINRAELPADETDTARSTRATRANGPAFSALQFQDISDQLLAHAQVRLVSLLAEVNSIAAALTPDAAGQSRIDNLVQMVVNANNNLAALNVSLVKPVGKDHLGTGDMELF
mgnify:CR=1 FL=1